MFLVFLKEYHYWILEHQLKLNYDDVAIPSSYLYMYQSPKLFMLSVWVNEV